MRIEDFWTDIDIYHVSFEVSRNEILRKIDKTVAFPAGTTEEEVVNIVTKRFSKVINVQCIDYWEDALLLKR